MGAVSEFRSHSNPRWRVAEEINELVHQRWRADVMAVGVHGSLAHGDDTDASDVNIVVVTYQPGAGPRPCTRRVDGVIVDLGVISAEEYLAHARTLSTSWPLAADQYLTTKALYDVDGWHERLRDTHLSRLADATGRDFSALAREAWCYARSLHAKSAKLADWHDIDGAVLVLGEARAATAVVDGLLSRTYFRHSADAVARTGLAGADIAAVGERLETQVAELVRHGRPVDGRVADLLG